MYAIDVQSARVAAPVFASIFSGAKADGRSINKSRSSFEELVQLARADHAQLSALQDEAQTSWLELTRGSADIAQLLAEARAARDLACSEAEETSRVA